ncbi:Na+/H+ antiporter [Lichenihabitans sp. Uapishka_5]|uniref:Na+/H+ antiporter n=1 Tax=Lichenihabitans sp. Uapishka_5 TaxID=3037302 RepID=UPI0029E8032B|nr:Na+/H+ antiporter [Lichenihabitans sp. Uapishka_5]MDX7951832.1 Na+/H+ antiporter [Lichenihabitans sp. Uapishka_5]
MSPTATFQFILVLLAVVVLLERIARRLGLPPSALLVLAGVCLALVPGVPEVHLDPDLTLVLFLPPLLFSGAYFTVWRDFRANLRIIMQLAVGAVAFTTLVVGVVTHWLVPGLPWAACFALGAIVSPPDAVAAKAVLQGLPLPGRLVTLLEGESLVNDAAGLVLFRFAIAAGMTGIFDPWLAVGTFTLLAVGGVVVGLAFGWITSRVLGLLREPHLNIVGGFLAAWASYVLGEHLHVSGVLATVTAGLVIGWRQHEVFGALTRVQANAVWSVVVFVLESLIFILIGLALRNVRDRLGAAGVDPAALLPDIAVIVTALVMARFAWVMTSTYLVRFLFPAVRRRDPYPSVAVPIVIGWAGMRGVVSLAVALSIPDSFPGRDFIMAATMAVILVSILLQGTTLRPLITALRLQGFALERQGTLSEAQARIQIAEAEAHALAVHSRQADGRELHPRLVEQYRHRASMATRYVESSGRLADDRRAHFEAVMVANAAGRRRLLELHRKGDVHDSVLHTLEADLDLEEIGAQRILESQGFALETGT